MIRTCYVAAFALFASAANAAVLTVPGIPSFDTNLGTLLTVQVTIDPIPTTTSPYDAGPFESISNHNHIVSPFPVSVPGLDSFPFAATQTNFVNPGLGDSHTHIVNIPPSVKTFGGPDLAWFLNPANGVNTVNVVAPPTSMNEDHNHTINFLPVVPTTRFTFEPAPVPEPTTALLLAAGLIATCGGRRRV